MSSVAFRQVDVFTTVPFKGNPVAVILDARELSSAQMHINDDSIRIGGYAVTCIEGTFSY